MRGAPEKRTMEHMTQTALIPHGAHLALADTDHGPLFWLSPSAQLSGPKPIRGGVPIIGPWFADLTGQTPGHGWARVSTWELAADGTEARIEHDDWELAVALNVRPDGIKLAYCATNHATSPRRVQLAFHPYFLVDDVRNITVAGLDGTQLYDRAAEVFEEQVGPLTVSGEFDRIIATDRTQVTIQDPGLGRSISIEASGTDAFVVWNPGETLGTSMPEVGEQWPRFVCVEPALLGAGLQGELLTPGERRCITMEVTVTALP